MMAIFIIDTHNSLTLIFKSKFRSEGKQQPICGKTWRPFSGFGPSFVICLFESAPWWLFFFHNRKAKPEKKLAF